MGARASGELWTIEVLGQTLIVDTQTGSVRTPEGLDVKETWQILVLHYLAIGYQPHFGKPDRTFADFPDALAYSKVYQGRVIERFCYTAGRDLATLTEAASKFGGRETDGGDKAFEFLVFPRLTIKLIWYAPDDEFPPSATILLPGNILGALSIEDIVVLSEQLVATLGGKGMAR